jgi:hypothetical protein
VPTIVPGDLAPARQRTVTGPVVQRLPPQILARTTTTARSNTVRARHARTVRVPVTTFPAGVLQPGPSERSLAAGRGAAAHLAHQQLVGGHQGERRPRRDHPPVAVCCATATFAARLAALPTTSSTQGMNPPRPPERKSVSNVVDAATIIPSTENGVSAATQPG